MPQWITTWRAEEIAAASPHPPEIALRLIRDGIDARYRRHVSRSPADFVILGAADERGIRICAARPFIENSWRTLLRARLVPDGSGSRLEGRLGWRPAVAVLTVATTLILIALWAFLTGAAVRAVLLGVPAGEPLASILLITAFGAAWAVLVAFGERMSRAETAHLRAWLTGRLNSPAPSAPPNPRPPTPPAVPRAPVRLRPAAPG
ncbi:hypothetical protein QLQ12_15715 [Actinoplanes sp. NEAU-A12]|uniref:Uncharacterized protein n=1 Tax=Actinoplanes sandaracinus TaxID=3045177 RepID=A0ABT6WJZ2_9ACTN|nr:hypothetical protein [Actinoplanes sandaracinus]MDI6100049.1 hypothetical protein [Actinoplanes sandaracinus]